MQLSKRIIAVLLTVAMILSLPITAWATPDKTEKTAATTTAPEMVEIPVTTSAAPNKEQRLQASYEAHDAKADRKQFLQSTPQTGATMLGNDYIQFYVDAHDSGEMGRFTIGNVEGNPNYTSDNNKILLFGHPSPWSSYTTIQIDNTTYIFEADELWYEEDALTATATMTVENVLITQTLQIVPSSGNIADTVKISYQVQNQSGVSKNIGVRIMMDTMLGRNDGAPFKVPSLGNVTYERQLVGNAVPQFWQCFDNLDNPSVFAVGTFYKPGERKPDKVQFTNWGNVYNSDHAWNYTINPNQAVTGDSAVSAYWNPVTVTSGQSLSVNTYYGVGYATGDADTSNSTQVGTEGFSVQVVDETGAQLTGATVTAQNLPTAETVTTDRGGLANFTNVPSGTGDTRTVTLKVEKEGYRTITVDREVTKGGFTSVTLYPDDGNIHIISAKATIDGTSTDLMTNYKHFKENAADTEAAEDESNVKWLSITVDAIAGSSAITKYQLMQGGEVKVESSTPTFRIPVFTGTPSEPNKYRNDWRIDSLDAGKNVYLRLVDASGNATPQKPLGIKVSKPTLYGMGDTDGTLAFGRELKISVPSNIPIIGDTDIELGWSGLPFQFTITEEGKVKFAINPKIDMLTGEVDWGDAEKEFDTKQLQAIERRLDAAEAFGGKPTKFGAGSLSVDANIMGYGEGYIDEHGNVIVDVGLIISIEQEAGYTWTFFLGYVPVYIAVGEKVTLTGHGQLNIVGSNGNISVTGASGSIKPEITLNVDGGVGANGVLNIGASGRATLSWLHRFNDNYNLVDLTGGVYIVAQAFLFKAEKKLAEGTWTIYEGYGNRASSVSQELLAQSTDFYDSESYVQLDRDYLASAAPYAADSGIVKAGVYSDASPMLVKVGDTAYLFWLEDITTRDASNRTALVYATSTDMETWSDPVQIFEETEDSTADFNFDICVDGSNIHLALCKENTVFTEETATLDAMAAASEIYYAKLNTQTGDVTTQQLTDNDYADTMPQIAVHNGSVVVAYTQNRMEDGFFGGENTHTVMLTTVGTNQTQSVSTDALISDIALGELDGEITVAYVLDTDRDYNTQDDTSLWTSSGSNQTCLAEAGTGAASALFTHLDGSDVLMWYADNNVYYTDGAEEPQAVFESLPYHFNRNFFAIEGDGNTELVWVGTTGTQENYQSAAYAVSYRDGRWSESYKMFDTESELTMTLDGYCEDGKTYVTYLKTYGVQEDTIVPSLCVSEVTPEYNLSLLNHSYDVNAVSPGQTLPITVTVKNTGNEDVDTVYLQIQDSYYETYYSQTIEDAQLERGETATFTLDDFMVPSWLNGPADFSISVECDNESSYDDNSATFTMGYTDLAVETGDLLVNGEENLNIIVKNLSGMETDATLRIQADSTEGAVLYEKRLTGLNKENVTSVLVNLNRLTSGTSIDKYYVCVDADTDEQLLSDNTHLVYRALTNEQLYTLNVSAGNGGYVTGDVGGNFSAGQQLTVTVAENRGYRFIGWTSDCDIEFSDPTSLTTSFTMPSQNANVSAVFEDVSIYLYMNEGSIALCSEQTFQLSYSTSTEEDIADSLFWTTSNPEVATVDENGLVTAVSDGYADITLTSADNRIIPATCSVYVSNEPYIQLYLDSYELLLATGETAQLSYSYDLEEDLSDTLYWETSDSEIATVDENGLITAVGAGQATITLASTDERVIPTTCYVIIQHFICTDDFTDLESDHPYSSHADNTWKLRIPCATAITLTFDEQSDFEHGYDQLRITNADYSFDYSYTGTELAGTTIMVPGDEVTLNLTSDGSVENWGFKVTNAVVEGYAHNTDGIGGTCTGCYTGWVKDNNQWYYCIQGVMQTGWQMINNTWYYMAQNGIMQTGWLQSGSTWYYLQSSGAMATGWQQVNGKWYYFQSSGAMATGWLQLGSTWYYLQSSGAMATGVCTVGSNLHRFNASGVWLGQAPQSGWFTVGNTWYYAQNSRVVTGWKSIGGKYYYFSSTGAMQTGWLQSGSTWYYLQSSGAMATGWQQLGGKYYYFKASGAMLTGWLQSGSTWYYLQSSGAMATGWAQVNGKWYYFRSSGAMQTGWLQLGNTWYYLQSSGAMATGTVNIGGKAYKFNASGAWIG